MGKVAAMIGKPLMPWQQLVADVAFELDPETLRLVYREVRVTVPRQSGKTTLVLAVTTHRGLATRQFGPRNHIVYTAQTRKDAGLKWREDFLEDIKAARALRGKFTYKLNPGSEHVRWSNGSRFGVEATTEKAGHGTTLDLGVIDEAFAHVDARVEQAFKPAMITRPQAQLWIPSTAGWVGASPYLWQKVESGRALVESGVTSGVCFFEWSAPEDADPRDPEVWRACMPALGYTVTEDAIAAESASMDLNGFRRAFLNHWVPKDAPPDQVIPASAWELSKDASSRPSDPLAFSFDMNLERSRGSIGVAGRAGDAVHVEVVDDRAGVWWMVDRIVQLNGLRPCVWYVDGRSPATSLIPELRECGIEVEVASAQEFARACGDLYDRATTSGRLVHLGQPELAAAIAGASKMPVGDAYRWARKGEVDISPLCAVTGAAHGLALFSKPKPSLTRVKGKVRSF